jgi:hypothetical protein
VVDRLDREFVIESPEAQLREDAVGAAHQPGAGLRPLSGGGGWSPSNGRTVTELFESDPMTLVARGYLAPATFLWLIVVAPSISLPWLAAVCSR